MKYLNLKRAGIYLGLIISGVIIGLLLKGSPVPPPSQEVSESLNPASSHVEVWTCSMHPQIRESEAGDCSLCGMDLVPVGLLQEEVGENEVQMTAAAMQLANIQTTSVARGVVTREIRLQGVVNADERRLFSVTAHFDGRVERLYADFTGQYITNGQKLATLYSPDLVTAQKELFEALKLKNSNPAFYEAAIQKLKLWELTNNQIDHIIEKGEPEYYFDVYAHHSGTVHTKNISEGEHIMEGKIMFEIADLDHLWVLFEVYERDLPWISAGDSISFFIPAVPGKQFRSVISFIDPLINSQTRTASARVNIRNHDNVLKPEMFAEGIVSARLKRAGNSLMIPRSAVLWTGKRGVVYVRQPGYEQPTFQFREIQLGTAAGDHYVVQSGLAEGEEIATNGVFKIDAAAQLQGKISMMNPEGSKMPGGHGHHNMTESSAATATPADESQPGAVASTASFDVDEVFRDQLKKVFEAYLPVKDALIDSDAKKAAQNARALAVAIQNVDMNKVKGTAHAAWMEDKSVLQSSTEVILNEKNLEKARVALSSLSDQLYHTLVRFKVKGLSAYRQFCPMAFDFKGAYWLSNSDEILNPYFGDEMLTCGSVDAAL